MMGADWDRIRMERGRLIILKALAEQVNGTLDSSMIEEITNVISSPRSGKSNGSVAAMTPNPMKLMLPANRITPAPARLALLRSTLKKSASTPSSNAERARP